MINGLYSLVTGMFLLLIAGCGANGNPVVQVPTGSDSVMDFYAEAPLLVEQLLLVKNEYGNEREVQVFLPAEDGRYPLLQFQHGFISDVDAYSDLLSRLAGFGFIIVAPQMYASNPSTAPSVNDETTAAVAILQWAQNDLEQVLADRLPERNIQVSTADTGVFGHSRGGQIAWRMLFDHASSIQARAIAGVDPVDGDAPPFPPGGTGELVSDDAGAFDFDFPSLILGMGLGSTGVPGFECAPSNRNYKLFYDTSAAPRYEVVASDYGHSDMLNGDSTELVCLGAAGNTREDLRVFVAGQLAAYFSSVLLNQDHYEWLRDLSQAPVNTSGRFDDSASVK